MRHVFACAGLALLVLSGCSARPTPAPVPPPGTASAPVTASPTCGPVSTADQLYLDSQGGVGPGVEVFAATSDTGDWRIIAASIAGYKKEIAFLAQDDTRIIVHQAAEWGRVNWTGDRLAQGRRALDAAISCLRSR